MDKLVFTGCSGRVVKISTCCTNAIKNAPDAAKAFEKLTEKVQPQQVWSDKGTEFKGAFKNLSDKRGIATYTTASETMSAFAERNIRSLKNIMYKHMENKWTYHYISSYLNLSAQLTHA